VSVRKPAKRQGAPHIAEKSGSEKSMRINDLHRSDEVMTGAIATQPAWRLHVEFSTRARTAHARG
jgi:hypothetical protein